MASDTFFARRVTISAAVQAAVAAALVTTSGCYLAAPSCEDKTSTRELIIQDADYLPLEDGAFRIQGATYRSCFEACQADPATLEVRSCKPPTLRTTTSGPRKFALSCDALWVACDLPTIASSYTLGSGRKPEGLSDLGPIQTDDASALGVWLAQVARLEAASVPAFERLARELAAHGAPTGLVRAARRSMKDEIRHARVTAALSRRHGGRPVRPRIGALPVRPLDEMALENAVEGCVNETLGAMIATHQAARASDRRIQKAFARIAREETQHAELSWRILDWSLPRLSDSARARTLVAMRAAVDRVDARALAGPTASLRDRAGLPDVAAAERLLDEARRMLFESPARSCAMASAAAGTDSQT